MKKQDTINRIKKELRTIRDVPMYIQHYEFPEIMDDIEKRLIENLTKHNKDLTKKCLRCNDEGVLPIVDGNGKKVGERYCQDCSGISSSES